MVDMKGFARVGVRELFSAPGRHMGRDLRVDGWVRTARDSGNVAFLEINDGSCFQNLQAVLARERLPNYDEVARVPTGSSVRVAGTLAESPGARQPFELQVARAEVVTACPPDYPLQKKRHSLEFLRGMPHLRARTNTFSAAFRTRSVASFAVHRFFMERGFVHVHTPIITTSDTEGAGEMFRVTTLPAGDPPRVGGGPGGPVDFGRDFFGREASLTVSGQLEAEAFALAFGKVYTFGPTFRAENSNTPRHAAEFWMIEPEQAFADIHDDMDLAEAMVKSVVGDVLAQAPQELAFFDQFVSKGLVARLEALAGAEFARATYTEAVAALEKNNKNFEFPAKWGQDLQTEHERYLTEVVFGRPVFVTGYPKGIKAFYMRQNDDGETVAAMDLLVPGIGELVGGSQREERADVLLRRVRELGMAEEGYKWYLDLRRFGGAPHAGFGLGFERFLMYLTGLSNIRDVLPFPRTAGNAGNLG